MAWIEVYGGQRSLAFDLTTELFNFNMDQVRENPLTSLERAP